MALTISSWECGLRLRSVCSFGRRKRVLVRSNSSPAGAHSGADDYIGADLDLNLETSMKSKRDFEEEERESKSRFEALPSEMLNKIICGVEHDDLKRLLLVSKTVLDAALIAKECHFAYKTPPAEAATARNWSDVKDLENAPKQGRRTRCPLDKEQLADITVALWPKTHLCL